MKSRKAPELGVSSSKGGRKRSFSLLPSFRQTKLKKFIRSSIPSYKNRNHIVRGAGRRIDLIHVDNSSKQSQNLNQRNLIKGFIKGVEPCGCKDGDKECQRWEKRKKRARKRLSKVGKCSVFGHLGIEVSLRDIEGIKKLVGRKEFSIEGLKLKKIPHRCNSLICPICSFYDARRNFAKIFDLLRGKLKLKEVELSFITLTITHEESVKESVEYAFGLRTKAYQFRLGKKNLEKLRKEVIKEFREYLKNLRKAKKYEKQKVERIKKQIREFVKGFVKSKEGKKLGQVLNAIWKFETHKSKTSGWHSHWHVLSDMYIPKVVLNAWWKFITKGKGRITHIRKVDGLRGVKEISKYETKPVNSKLSNLQNIEKGVYQSNGVYISYDELVELEASLYGRKKITVWGEWLDLFEREGEKEEKETYTLHLPRVEVSLKVSLKGEVRRYQKSLIEAVKRSLNSGEEIELAKSRIYFENLALQDGGNSKQYSFDVIEIAKGSEIYLKPLFEIEEDFLEKEMFEFWIERELEGMQNSKFLGRLFKKLEEVLEEYEKTDFRERGSVEIGEKELEEYIQFLEENEIKPEGIEEILNFFEV